MIISDGDMDALMQSHTVIRPYHGEQMRYAYQSDTEFVKLFSSGQSSGGYDISLAPTDTIKCIPGRLSMAPGGAIIDPKHSQPEHFFTRLSINQDENDEAHWLLPPRSFALAQSYEYFHLPDDVMGFIFNKSTLVRWGLECRTTVLEPGWRGYITMEFDNPTDYPFKLYARPNGCAQVVLVKLTSPALVPYNARPNCYQNQKGITHGSL